MAPAPRVETNEIKSSALELIGNTPLVALDRLHSGPGRILAKCEFMNPGGSIKDRSSLYMINAALKNGELKPGNPILEVTSGNQGCGLAVVAAVKDHPLTIYMSAGNSEQRAIQMEACGAKCIRVPQVEGVYGKVTYADVQAAEEECLKTVEKTGHFLVNQFYNEANVQAHYEMTGPEIWRQTGGHVDAFVATAGTSGTFSGTSKYLKEKNPAMKAFIIEPEGAEVIAGKPVWKACHKLQGSGYGVVPALFKYDVMDGTLSVSDAEAVHYKRLLGEKEGLYVGYTSGANVAAAVKLLQSGNLPEDAWVVTMLNDTGLKYSPTLDEIRSDDS